MSERDTGHLIPIEQGMALLKMIEECSDWCVSTHRGRLLCPTAWRPGSEVVG